MTPVHARVAAAHRSVLIIIIAIASSVAIYIVAGLYLVPGPESQSEPDQSRLALIVVAVGLALGSIALRRTQLSSSRLQAVAARRGTDGLIKHFFTVTLILAALAEGIGILAILVRLLGGTQLDVIVFGLVAAVILLSNLPRRAAWERAVDFFSSSRPGPIA